jgi:hypothetical protein
MSPMASALPRPRQVTIAGWMIMAGSAAVVLTVFQQIAGLHSIDTREAVQRVLAQPPFDGIGMSVDQVLDAIRVLSMIAAACATATAILGWQVLQRSKSARVALSVLAVPLLVTGLGTGGILSTAVVVAVLLLWLQPARDWFDGLWRPPVTDGSTTSAQRQPSGPSRAAGSSQAQQAPEHSPEQSPSGSPPQSPQSPPQSPQSPPPYSGWPPPQGIWPLPQGSPTPPPAGWAPPAPPAPPAQAWPPAAPLARAQARRPPAVLAAAVLTWVCSLLLGGLFVVGAAYLISSPDTLMDEMTKQQPQLVRDGTLTVGLLRATLAVMVGLIVVWVLAACVLAFFVLRRAAWARMLLLVCCGAAGLLLVVSSIVNPVMVVPLAGAAATFALLVRRDVTAWFKQR